MPRPAPRVAPATTATLPSRGLLMRQSFMRFRGMAPDRRRSPAALRKFRSAGLDLHQGGGCRFHGMTTPRTQRYLRIVWLSALYDLLVTALFATPWTAALALGHLRRLHDALGVGG